MKVESDYLVLIVMNFVIALCMIGTPLAVKSVVGAGFTAFTSSLTPPCSNDYGISKSQSYGIN